MDEKGRGTAPCDRCGVKVPNNRKPDVSINARLRGKVLCLTCFGTAIADPDGFWREGDWGTGHDRGDRQ